jgi:hypothetical protein
MCSACAPRWTAKGCLTLGSIEYPKRCSEHVSAPYPWSRDTPDQTHNPSVAGSSPARPTGVPAGQPGLSRFGLSGSARTSSRERLRSGRPMASSKDRLGRSRGTVCSPAS